MIGHSLVLNGSFPLYNATLRAADVDGGTRAGAATGDGATSMRYVLAGQISCPAMSAPSADKPITKTVAALFEDQPARSTRTPPASPHRCARVQYGQNRRTTIA